MAIRFRCPYCQQLLGIAQKQAGAKIDCPACGRGLRVPDADGIAAPFSDTRLNLTDEQLIKALGTLAENPTADRPVIAAEPAVVDIELQSAPVQPAVDPPGEHPQPVPDQSLLKELDSLTSHRHLEPPTHLIQPPQIKRWHTVPVGILLIALPVMFLCGGVIGRAIAPQRQENPPMKSEIAPDPVALPDQTGKKVEHGAVIPAGPTVRGSVTFTTATGEKKPDRQARVLILPLKRQGTAKLAGPGMRVGAEETDIKLLEAEVSTLQGRFTQADSHGNFEITLNEPGQYGLLVASRFQPRPAAIPLDPNCKIFLERYFDRPDNIIGDVEYQYMELKLDPASTSRRDIQFISR